MDAWYGPPDGSRRHRSLRATADGEHSVADASRLMRGSTAEKDMSSCERVCRKTQGNSPLSALWSYSMADLLEDLPQDTEAPPELLDDDVLLRRVVESGVAGTIGEGRTLPRRGDDVQVRRPGL